MLSLTALRKAAKKIIFDPKKPGPMAVIVDMNDPQYWKQRTLEILKEGDDSKLEMCGALILMAIAHGQNKETRSARSKNSRGN